MNGIGAKLERRLWASGVLTWKDFIGTDSVECVSNGRKKLMDERLCAHMDRLEKRDAPWFKEALKNSEHWRLFEIFRDETVCLDIETNGWHPGAGGYVTMVGLYDGYDYRCLLMGEDLSAENLMKELSRYKYMVTFYGSAFDVPFLKSSLSGFNLRIPHFDLCFGARRLGFKGGLKRLEEKFGIERDEETRGMDGYDAVILWNEFRKGSSSALELLVKYNREDTVNLWDMAETIYEGLRESTGIDRYANRGLIASLN